jgi:foldase protein PrsA
MWSYKTLIYTLSVLVLAACAYWRIAAKEQAEGRDKPIPGLGGDKNDPRLAELEDGVFFQVDDIKIMDAPLQTKLDAMIRMQQKTNPGYNPPAEQRMGVKKDLAQMMLGEVIMERYVAEKKIGVPKEDVDEYINSWKKELAEFGQSLDQIIKDNGSTDEEMRRMFHNRMSIEKEMMAAVTDEEMKKAFDPADPAIRRASHVLIAFKEAPGAESLQPPVTRTKEEAKARAEEALAKVKSGMPFPEAAMTYSDARTKVLGGDLNFVARGHQGDQQLTDTIYSMAKVGDLAGPVESPYGWHVVKLTGMRTTDEARKEARRDVVAPKVMELTRKLTMEMFAKGKFNSRIVPSASREPQPLNFGPGEEAIEQPLGE